MSGRIRTIKPEILEDEVTSALPDGAWRLFVSLMLLADDYGNTRAKASFIEGQAFWATRDGTTDTERDIDTLVSAGLVQRYTVRGQTYLHLKGWSKHQKIDKPGKPRCPKPEEASSDSVCEFGESFANDSRTARESFSGHNGPTPESFSAPSDPCPESFATDRRPVPTTIDQEEDPEGNARATVSAETEDTRETCCPLDLDVRFPAHSYAELSKALKVPEDSLRKAAKEFVEYWTIGGGQFRRRSQWARKLREHLRKGVNEGRITAATAENRSESRILIPWVE